MLSPLTSTPPMSEPGDTPQGEILAVMLENAANSAGQFQRAITESAHWHSRALESSRELLDRAREVDAAAQGLERLRRELESAVKAAPDDVELGSLALLLDAWARKPMDVLILVKLAEQAGALTDVVRTFRAVRKLVSDTESR